MKMAPSNEGASMDAFLKEEKRGFQEGARGETPINLNPSAEPIAS